jgi:excinuclease UvrABC nuclease subunit
VREGAQAAARTSDPNDVALGVFKNAVNQANFNPVTGSFEPRFTPEQATLLAETAAQQFSTDPNYTVEQLSTAQRSQVALAQIVADSRVAVSAADKGDQKELLEEIIRNQIGSLPQGISPDDYTNEIILSLSSAFDLELSPGDIRKIFAKISRE